MLSCIFLGAMHLFETHLADAASLTELTEGADGAHVALVSRPKGWGMNGGRVQRDTWVGPHISGLQVVALAEQGQGVGIDTTFQRQDTWSSAD